MDELGWYKNVCNFGTCTLNRTKGWFCDDHQPVSHIQRVRAIHDKKPVIESSEWRKQRPLAEGCLDYFPDALMAVAHCSWVGNQQHNPGQPLHWAKEKSADHANCIMRHLKDRGTLDSDGVKHSAKVAWRALALLQMEIEKEKANG